MLFYIVLLVCMTLSLQSDVVIENLQCNVKFTDAGTTLSEDTELYSNDTRSVAFINMDSGLSNQTIKLIQSNSMHSNTSSPLVQVKSAIMTQYFLLVDARQTPPPSWFTQADWANMSSQVITTNNDSSNVTYNMYTRISPANEYVRIGGFSNDFEIPILGYLSIASPKLENSISKVGIPNLCQWNTSDQTNKLVQFTQIGIKPEFGMPIQANIWVSLATTNDCSFDLQVKYTSSVSSYSLRMRDQVLRFQVIAIELLSIFQISYIDNVATFNVPTAKISGTTTAFSMVDSASGISFKISKSGKAALFKLDITNPLTAQNIRGGCASGNGWGISQWINEMTSTNTDQKICGTFDITNYTPKDSQVIYNNHDAGVSQLCQFPSTPECPRIAGSDWRDPAPVDVVSSCTKFNCKQRSRQ
jgi:hypothetical protein